MAKEHLSVQNDMSKEDAVTSVQEETHNKLVKFGDRIKGGLSKASAMTSVFILTTFNANAQLPKTNDVVKNNDPKKTVAYKPVGEKKDTVRIVKTGEKGPEDPIKNKKEYDAEYARLLKLWKESEARKKESTEELELLKEQSDLLMGAMEALDKIQKQNGVVTEADIKMAKGFLRVIAKKQWHPALQGLLASAKRIYEYLASQTPQQLYTKTK